MSQKYHIDITNLMNLPANVYWKNQQGVYLGCNDHQLADIGFKSPKDFVGATLFDFPFIDPTDLDKIDNQIMQENKVQFIIESRTDTQHLYFSIKQPLYDNTNQLAGMLGVSFNIKELEKQHSYHLLNLLLSARQIAIETRNYFSKTLARSEIKFSKREQECLFYLQQGRSTKEIAQFLKISARTVESHIGHIKEKLNCRTKSQILDKITAY